MSLHTPKEHRRHHALLRDLLRESIEFAAMPDDEISALDILRAENERLRAYCGAQIARSEFATADDMRAALDRERAAHTATAKELWDLTAERDATATASNSV